MILCKTSRLVTQQDPPKKILAVEFYCETNGNEPVRKWLKSFDKENGLLSEKTFAQFRKDGL